MKAFQLIKVKAETSYERGIQYGQQAKDKIIAGIKDYKWLFSETSDMSWDDIRKNALNYIPLIEEYFPDTMEEARGIADGANVDIGEIMVLNCRYEITKFPKEKECTSFSLLSEATKNKSTYVGQNWDYRIGVFENTVLVHIENPDGTKIFGMTEAGQVIRNGFNSNGIGLCANNLQSIYDKSGIGLPVTFVRREILNCKTFEEASSLLENYKRVVSCNYMLASIEDKAMDFEVYPMGNDKIFPVNGIVAHGNHFVVQPEIHALDQSPRGDRRN
jgi:isopenicillin-N N-acyltransferase-like protein